MFRRTAGLGVGVLGVGMIGLRMIGLSGFVRSPWKAAERKETLWHKGWRSCSAETVYLRMAIEGRSRCDWSGR